MPASKKLSPRRRSGMVAYAKEHGPSAAATKYGVSNNAVHYWLKKESSTNAASPSTKPRNNDRASSSRLEAIALLRRAVKLITNEIRSGAEFRPSDAYVRLSLDELEGKKG